MGAGAVCTNCEAELRQGARFCDRCGRPVAAEPDRLATSDPGLPASFAAGRYRVQRLLGEGGRKLVYLAHDQSLDRNVAIALIKVNGIDEEGLARFRSEAQAMGRLGDHPRVVAVYDIGEENGQPFIVSQYMAGGSVADLLAGADDHRLPVDRAITIASDICQALEHAHGRGLVHRDLKPGNVWLSTDGRAKLGDFGLAMATGSSRITQEGMIVGTVAYLAPEQAIGRGKPDARSDLYALGAMLYETVTGRPPFVGDEAVAVISQHLNTPPLAPSWHNPAVPRALEALILRLLSKKPGDRPQSAAAVRETLASIAARTPTTSDQRPVEANPLDRLAGGVFVGREREVEQLRSGLEEALAGRGRLILLVGEPGIGKTSTADELATYAQIRGAQVLAGRCYEGEGAPAYWPWVQVIRAYIHERDPQTLVTDMGPGAADIAQVVSDVRERLPGLPTLPALDPEQGRFRLFDSVTTFLKNAANRQPIVVILDDLHWADRPSLLLLQFLAREMQEAHVLVVGAYRDVELGRHHPLAQTLGELARLPVTQRVSLHGLSETDIAHYIQMTAGVDPPLPLVLAVHAETEGNPFFFIEVVRLLTAEGRLESPGSGGAWRVEIPQSVREVIGRRLDHLSEDCNVLLTVASVIGREFALSLLRPATDLPPDRLLGALEEAVAARVVNEVPGSIGRYSFSHTLIRETLYGDLATVRRARLHQRVGDALEAINRAHPEPHLAELAHHFYEAAHAGDVDKAIRWCTRAGQRAMSQLAYEEAAGHYEHALQALELLESPDDGQRAQLVLTMGDAWFRAGEPIKARDSFRAAIEIARAIGDSTVLARAVLGLGPAAGTGTFGFNFNVDPEFVALLGEVLDTLPQEDSALRARALGAMAVVLYWTAPRDEREQYSRLAVEMAQRIGDRVTLADTLFSRRYALWDPEDIEERLAASERVRELAEAAGNAERLLEAHMWRAVDLLELGHAAGADEEIEQHVRLAGELRQPFYQHWAVILQTTRALMKGRFADAEELAARALAMGERRQYPMAVLIYGCQMLWAWREQGRVEELQMAMAAILDMAASMPAAQAGLAFTCCELGRLEEARDHFEKLAVDDFASLPRDVGWLSGMAMLAMVCSSLGDARRAEVLYDKLAPYADRNIVVYAALCLGPAPLYLGMLAVTKGERDVAAAHYERAIEMSARSGARPFLAHAQQAYAELLLDRGQRSRALVLLNEALATALDLGMPPLTEATLALKLRAQGVAANADWSASDTIVQALQEEEPDLAPHAAPDGTVTILFTDIEDSTAMAVRLGDDRWLELLRAHNAVVRREIANHDGWEVKSQGDGFMVAFGSPHNAVQCAVATQQAFAAAADSRSPLAGESIRVRIGVHTGEVARDAADYIGTNVILAARIADAADGGEVLVSSVVKELIETAGVVRFGPDQHVALKGLSGLHTVYPVNWSK